MAHICIILEGTYPYQIGGVSTWVHKIVTGLPEHDFSIVHLYFGNAPSGEKFLVPENVRVVSLPILIDERHADFDEIIANIPRADVYHALSTGFAGWIGAELKQRSGKPFMLTEHGIYWHEIEIGADEIECGFKLVKMNKKAIILGKNWASWLQFFKRIALRAYKSADLITTVSHWNRKMQISFSRYAKKSSVIFNGVKLPDKTRKKLSKDFTAPAIGLVGRVTPIKDIETFILACDRVRRAFPDARFYVIGPIENDSNYYLKCKKLANDLGLMNLFFTGRINALNFYSNLDLVVLTSVSEGQPFALLEAMAAGIPIVATDVGGCEEIIFGANDGFGQAGLLCGVGDVAGISAAMLQILKRRTLWNEFSENGRKRIERFYSEEKMISNYRILYEELCNRAIESYWIKTRSA